MLETQVIAALIAAVTALVAVIIGPFISFRASKRAMLGPMRQAWINSLRDTVAEFIANVSTGPIQLSGQLSYNDQIRHETEASRRDQLEAACRLKEKVWLLINPGEPDHAKLGDLVEQAYLSLANGTGDSGLLVEIREQAQAILKREWNVVKK